MTKPACTHPDYENGKCTSCGQTCSHKTGSSWNSPSAFVNGVCSVCDYECPHSSYDNQNKCRTCGMAKAACTHPEYKDGKCTKCGANCNHSKSEPIPNKAPTCGEAGTTGGTRCTVCGSVRQQPTTVPATGDHDYKFDKTLVEPNCSGKGKDQYKCSVCGETKVEETTAGSHIWVFVRYQEGNAATCTDGGVGVFDCKYCDEVSAQNVPALGHDGVVLGDIVAPSCDVQGIRGFKCGREGCTTMWLDYVDATGHTEAEIAEVPATCTSTGLSAGVKCTVCKKILTPQAVTEMVPHTFGTPVRKVDATCTADGYTAHNKCNYCDATEGKEVIHLLGHNFVNYICTRCHVRDGSCEHKNGVIDIKQPTCTENGWEKFDCPTCDYAYNKTLNKLGHTTVNGICTTCGASLCNHRNATKKTIPSTCTKQGSETYTCSCGWSMTVELDLASHKYVNGKCSSCGHIGSTHTTIDFQDIFFLQG